ncbi:MAG: Mu transposase C-terminal domain-containing protein [Steroidobacteraceae bacterium]
MSGAPTAPELLSVAPPQWDRALRYLSIVRRLSESSTRTRAEVAAAAAELGCGVIHLYALLGRYQADPRLTSLLPRRRGPAPGGSLLSGEVNAVIDDAIQAVYLTRQKPRISDLLTEIRRRCHALQLKPPGRWAVTARLLAKPQSEVVARRLGRKAARDRFSPAVGSLEPKWPLALVQIDHTLVDVIVVDSVTRMPIRRPWLTLAIDVYSRCVVGFHLTLEPPSATSVALCIAHTVLSKGPWLSERKIEAEWAMEGLIEHLHLDNAKEFHSEALRRGCEQYGIGIEYRPVRTPHYGAHIERLIGTMMGKVHLLPGTTFSDVSDKGDYDSEKNAAVTMDELERWLAHEITGVYHRQVHSALGTPPLAAWERGIAGDAASLGRGTPIAVPDPHRLLIDFLPIERRLIRREGISLHSISYWSDVLRAWIGVPEKMIVRYDPRDLSRIYLLGPDGRYYDIPYRDLGRPPITLWEQRLALKRLREEGRSHVDENAIFRTIEMLRKIADEAVRATKTIRRQQERRLHLIQGGRSDPTNPVPVNAPGSDVEVQDDDSSTAHLRILPFEEWT